MQVRWLQRADGPRDKGYVEEVDDHLGEQWIGRGLVEQVRGLDRPPEHRAMTEAPNKKGRKEK